MSRPTTISVYPSHAAPDIRCVRASVCATSVTISGYPPRRLISAAAVDSRHRIMNLRASPRNHQNHHLQVDMSNQESTKVSTAHTSGQNLDHRRGWRPGWRKMTWALIVWTVFIVAWAIGGGLSAGSKCARYTGQYAQAQQEGCHAGTAIGVTAIIVLGFLGFFALGLVWLMTRPKNR